MTGIIYVRYSSENQREESIEGQIRECKAYAGKNGITILNCYIDRALSAKTDNRPQFQKLMRFWAADWMTPSMAARPQRAWTAAQRWSGIARSTGWWGLMGVQTGMKSGRTHEKISYVVQPYKFSQGYKELSTRRSEIVIQKSKIASFLTFNGNAEKAMQLYASVFPGGEIVRLERYGKDHPSAGDCEENKVLHGAGHCPMQGRRSYS